MASQSKRALLLFGTAAAAALGFGIVTDRVHKHGAARFDRTIQHKLRKRMGRSARAAARASGPLGKWYAHLPLALGAARQLHNQDRDAGAAAIASASVAASVLSRVLDRVMPHRAPPPARQEPWEQSYPSGHSLETTAVALTASYVLVREGRAPTWVSGPLLLAALASGVGRLALERHWATDLAGGYLAGIALGASCAGVYELAIQSRGDL